MPDTKDKRRKTKDESGNAFAARTATAPQVQLTINGRAVRIPEGSVVAAAIAAAGVHSTRRSVEGEARGPLCGMGICYECRVTIDDRPYRLACQVVCADGMRVVTE